MRPEWESWLDDIHNLQFVKIPRSLKPSDFGNPTIKELHYFSDASTSGYGQVSYIRYVNEAKVHCSMLMSKSRVAPQKVVTIPRLELTAATLSVKMSLFLKEELGLKINREYFWTDSRVVLGYINNDARRFHVFVANRVQLIREATEPDQWFYVKSEDNPADHASRGLTASGITNSTWLQGPSFLWKRNIETNQVDTKLQLGDPEVKTVRSLRTQSRTFPNLLERFSRISNWSTLVSVIARLQRLSNGVKGTQPPTIEERRVAERKILTLVQHDAFKDSIGTLEKSETLSKKNALYPLDPLLRNGLLCVGGRLRKAKLSLQHQHPVILPKDNHITRLILRHVHQQVWHQGRGITLNKLKSSGYWIIGGSKTVANMIRQCVVCRKLRRPTETQRMADLPEERVVPSPPFTYCGMDCFGPFMVKQGRREVKRYGLLLTCMCTRAIHIEMLDDMTTDAFINGLRCFIAIRGAVRQIRSDQGTNFVGARNELEREIRISKVNSALAEKQCEFIMNAPCASHTGGVWERQIKSVRNILDSVLLLCPGRLDDSSLRTLFYEAMAIVNSRPLAISEIDDPNALEPLTPNHILTAKSDIPHPPPGEFVKQDLLLRKRWRRVQYLLEQFWSRWKKEYVSHIALRQKWLEPRRNICVGDVVLVKDVSFPRNQWPLAKVIEANADDDGLVRRVKVKTGTKGSTSPTTLERSVHKVVLLIEQ